MEDKKINPVDIYVGSRLRMRRSLLGISQNKMGSLIGVTFQQVQKYEKGVNRIGSSRLYQISKILLIPISYFFDGYDEAKDLNSSMVRISEKEEPIKYKDLDNNEIARLIKSFIRISNPVVKKNVITLVKSLGMNNNERDLQKKSPPLY